MMEDHLKMLKLNNKEGQECSMNQQWLNPVHRS